MSAPGVEPPVRGFLPRVDGRFRGRPAAEVRLAYCNMRCPYCREAGLVLSPHLLPSFSIQAVVSGLAPGVETVVVTGGEPSMHRGLPLLCRALREAGRQVVLETNGTQPDMLGLLVTRGFVDHVVLDVKAPLDDEEAYSRCAGVPFPPEIVAESLEVLSGEDAPRTLVTTAVPGLLSPEEIVAVCRQAAPFGPHEVRPHDPSSMLEPEAAGPDVYTEQELARFVRGA